VFSSSPESHKEHLRITLDLLRTNQLFAKRSKCRFGCREVEYLGHIISAEGVSADPGKIKAMGGWPFPTTIKALRGFLGLTGYYRKFIHAPLLPCSRKMHLVGLRKLKKHFLS